MKTYPIIRDDGSLRGCELGNTFVSLRRISEILRMTDGVTGVRPTAGSDDRLMFEFDGETCVVHEPFGDNSRYWIGPAFPQTSTLDMLPICQSFARERSVLKKAMESLGFR